MKIVRAIPLVAALAVLGCNDRREPREGEPENRTAAPHLPKILAPTRPSASPVTSGDVEPAVDRSSPQDERATLIKRRGALRMSTLKAIDLREQDLAELRDELPKKVGQREANRILSDLESKREDLKGKVEAMQTASDFDAASKDVTDRLTAYLAAVDEAKQRL
jgi:hypothetical protein